MARISYPALRDAAWIEALNSDDAARRDESRRGDFRRGRAQRAPAGERRRRVPADVSAGAVHDSPTHLRRPEARPRRRRLHELLDQFPHAVDYAAKIPQIKQYLARADEPRWAAFWRTLVLDTEAQVLKDDGEARPPPEYAKIYVLLKRRPELALAAFRQTLIDDRAGLAKRFGFDRHLVGFSRDPLYAFGEPAFDAIECLSLRDAARLETLFGDRGFAEPLTARPYVHETYAFNFVARERWIISPGAR